MYVAGQKTIFSLASAQLINAYTINASLLSAAKISFVNFSDK